MSSVRRTEIRTSDAVGVVFEPEQGSDDFAVMLGGSYGGIPEGLGRRLAEQGVSTFALAYFGAPGLPSALIEIPIESLQRGIELFRERFAGGRAIGVMGSRREPSWPWSSPPSWEAPSAGSLPRPRRMSSGTG